MKVVLCLLVFLAAAVHAQNPGMDSPRETYASHRDDYAAEARELKATGGRVTRLMGRLTLRLASGRTITFSDSLNDADHYYRFVYLKYLPKPGVHVVATSFYEGGTFHIIHDRTGQNETVPGQPNWSPDSSRFASASSDLEAGYDPNALELWRVDSHGLKREYFVDGGDRWGPEEVKWLAPDRLSFVRMTLQAREAHVRVPVQTLQHANGRWTLRANTR